VTTPQIVIDTNVLVAGLRSRQGYAFRLLKLVGTGRFDINLSVPLVLEYEDILGRLMPDLGVSDRVVDDVLNYHCRVAKLHPIIFLWRPYLQDPQDDMVLELAVKAGCDYIVTFNKRHFRNCERFGLRPVSPREFLASIGAIA
jgi:putative PIN family toxin of toxin-antitoxin system